MGDDSVSVQSDISPQSVAAARAELHRQGFAVLRGLFDTQLMQSLAVDVTECLVEAGAARWTPSGTQPLYVEPTDDDTHPAATATMRILGREDFEAAVQSHRVMRVVAQLLGVSEVFACPQKVFRAVPPASSAFHYPAGVHQDYPELQGSLRQLTMWLPLTRVDASSGALPVYPASHLAGILPLVLADNPSGWSVDPSVLAEPSTPSLEAGDAIVFTTLTAHGGVTNVGTGWRLSIDLRFQPLADPICDLALTLPGQPFTWDEIHRDWQRYAHYWAERCPSRAPFDPSWSKWRDIESLRVGRAGDPVAIPALLIARARGEALVRETAASILERDFGVV